MISRNKREGKYAGTICSWEYYLHGDIERIRNIKRKHIRQKYGKGLKIHKEWRKLYPEDYD